MTLWLSYPSIFIPSITHEQMWATTQRVDASFAHLSAVFGRRIGNTFPEDIEEPGAETLLARAAAPLLSNTNVITPDVFVDCRSYPAIGTPAPTYKPASILGITSSLPFALSGQQGTEVAMALLLLGGLSTDQFSVALVTATQWILDPLPSKAESLTQSDAAAACVVTRTKTRADNLRLRAVVVDQAETLSGDEQSDLETLLERALQEARLHCEQVRWLFVQPSLTSLIESATALLPTAQYFQRSGGAKADYGCADGLISLAEWLTSGLCTQDDVIVLWMKGLSGSRAVLIIDR